MTAHINNNLSLNNRKVSFSHHNLPHMKIADVRHPVMDPVNSRTKHKQRVIKLTKVKLDHQKLSVFQPGNPTLCSSHY